MKNIKIFGGSANPQLTKDICEELGLPEGQCNITQFADKELYPQFLENIRGCGVFIIQPTCAPVNDNLMELMLMMNAAKLASAEYIVPVLPYFGYARQDRKDRPRVPISAQVVAHMLQTQGVRSILTMDLHSAPIQGFFSIPVDHLYALPVLIQYLATDYDFRGNNFSNVTVVSPDAGGTIRARLLAQKLKVPMAIIDKFREAANVSKVMNVIGDVEGRDCLIIDDMIDTAGTLVKAAEALMIKGAKRVIAAATHGLFSYDQKANISAIERIENSVLDKVIVMDTIPQKEYNFINGVLTKRKIVTLSTAKIFAQAITALHEDKSISSLFV